jgi:hypothetical protein
MTSCRLLVCAALLLSASSARADAWRVDDGPVFVGFRPVDSRAVLAVTEMLTTTSGGTVRWAEQAELSVAKLVPLNGVGAGVYAQSFALRHDLLGTRASSIEVGALARRTLREELDLALRVGVLAPFDLRPRQIVAPDRPPRVYVPEPERLQLAATLVGERKGPGFRVGVVGDLPLASWERWDPYVHLQLGAGGRKGPVAFTVELDIRKTVDADWSLVPGLGASLQYHTRHVIPYVAAGIRDRYRLLGLGVYVPL